MEHSYLTGFSKNFEIMNILDDRRIMSSNDDVCYGPNCFLVRCLGGLGELSISNFRDKRMTDLAPLKIHIVVDLPFQSSHPLHTHTLTHHLLLVNGSNSKEIAMYCGGELILLFSLYVIFNYF